MQSFVAIDPMALILPSAVYQRLVEKFHPHVAAEQTIAEVVKGMSVEERRFAGANAKRIAEYAQIVAKAVAPVAA